MSEQLPESHSPLPPAASGPAAPVTLDYVQTRERYDEVYEGWFFHLLRFLSPLMWGFIALTCVGLITGPLVLLTPNMFGIPLVLLTDGIVILAIARIVRVIRRNRAGAVVAVLEQAVRLNLPLLGFVAAAAAGERRMLGRRLQVVAAYLGQGMAVSDALRSAVPEIPNRGIALLASAERRGRLAPALASLREELRPWSRRLPPASYMPSSSPVHAGGIYYLYPLCMLLVIQILLAGMLIFIMPKYREIFNDFQVTLPLLTEFIMGTADSLFLRPGILFLLEFVVFWVVVFVLGRVVEQTLFLRRRVPLLGSWAARLRWVFPLTHSLDRDRGLADVCGLLADALRSGSTIPRAVGEALSLPMNIVLHERLANFATLHARGMPLAQAAAQARLPRLVSGLLATTGPGAAPGDEAEYASGLADALDFLQRYYGTRFSRLLVFVRSGLEPLCVLGLGLIVGTVVVAFFLPLVKLIQAVSFDTLQAMGG